MLDNWVAGRGFHILPPIRMKDSVDDFTKKLSAADERINQLYSEGLVGGYTRGRLDKQWFLSGDCWALNSKAYIMRRHTLRLILYICEDVSHRNINNPNKTGEIMHTLWPK